MTEQLTIFDEWTEQTTPIFTIDSFVRLAFDLSASSSLDRIYMDKYGKSVLGECGRVLRVLENDVYEIYVASKERTVYWYGRDLLLI